MTNPPDPKPMTEEQRAIIERCYGYSFPGWTREETRERDEAFRSLLASYDARGEALNSLLGWIGQCQSDDYVDWLFDRNTPGFERWKTVKEAKDTLRSVIGKGWSSLASPPPVAGEGGREPDPDVEAAMDRFHRRLRELAPVVPPEDQTEPAGGQTDIIGSQNND